MKHLKVISSSNVPPKITDTQPTHILLRILKWNAKRNNLDFNIELEANMLSEEASEFFHSETLVDRLDAYADFVFVGVGTVYKHLASRHKYFIGIQEDFDQMSTLTEWMNTVREQMIEIISNEILTLSPTCNYRNEEIIEEILNATVEIVVDANEKKGFERDSNGKVKKGDDYVKPEKTIHTLLKEKLGDDYVRYSVSYQF